MSKSIIISSIIMQLSKEKATKCNSASSSNLSSTKNIVRVQNCPDITIFEFLLVFACDMIVIFMAMGYNNHFKFLTVIFKRGVYTAVFPGQLIIITNGTSISTNKSISYIHICNSHSSTQGDIGQFKDGQDPGAFLSGFNNLNIL